jgi:hypothetical protein
MMAGTAYVLEGSFNQVDWRTSMVVDLVVEIEPNQGGRNTFLAKREC